MRLYDSLKIAMIDLEATELSKSVLSKPRTRTVQKTDLGQIQAQSQLEGSQEHSFKIYDPRASGHESSNFKPLTALKGVPMAKIRTSRSHAPTKDRSQADCRAVLRVIGASQAALRRS